MSTARHCDGPRCEHWAMAGDLTEAGFLHVDVIGHGPGAAMDFCSWDCALRFGAQLDPATEVLA